MTATVTNSTTTSRPAARPVKASVPVRDAVTQITTLAWRALVKMRRNPEQLVDVTFMPVLFTVMFGLMFGGANSIGSSTLSTISAEPSPVPKPRKSIRRPW